MYFSRANHVEYTRLTYVLSGVAEPSDLIRDKNISPFNIGEKIYLEDFNRAEFDAFITKAGLEFPQDVIDKIFSWTNGNPRITWDLCSEIEDRLLNGELIDTTTVDKVVDKIYLTELDRAPIDHIRNLVEADTHIRNAIVAIRYSKCEALDDKIKSKLYLAGITKPVDFGKLKIKNRVIDEALSDRWIEQISSAEKSILILANEAYNSGNYEQSIQYYEEALGDTNNPSTVSDIARLELGLAYLWTKQSSKAIAQFTIVDQSSTDLKVIQLSKLHIGTAYISAQNYTESIPSLQQAASGVDHTTAVNAKLNLLVAYLKSGTEENLGIAENLSEELVKTLEEKANDRLDVSLATALYHQSTIYEALKNPSKTLACIESALSHAPIPLKPFLLLAKIEKHQDNSKNCETLTEFVTLISENTIPLSEVSDSVLGLSKSTLAKGLHRISELSDPLGFDNFLSIIKSKYFRPSFSKFNIIINLAEETTTSDPDLAFELLVKCAQHYSDATTPIESTIKLYRNLATYSCYKPDDQWSMNYLRLLGQSCPEELIAGDDITATVGIIVQLWTRGDVNIGESLTIWKKFEEKSLQTDPTQSAALLFLTMLHEKNKDTAYEYGTKFIKTVSSVDEENTSQIWGPLKKQAEQIITSYETSRLKNIGRNSKVLVQYSNSERVEKKYKYVEDDIKTKKCALIEVTVY